MHIFASNLNNYQAVKGKPERHRIIREVVRNGKVASQEELAAILEGKGIGVAQATLSRDIRDLGITKLHDGTGYYYSLPGQASPKTGHANMVAALIDSNSLPEVAGTVAGDDTIILALRDGVTRDSLVSSLGTIFNGLEDKRLN